MATLDEISMIIINKVFQEILYKEDDGEVIDEIKYMEIFTDCLYSELDYFIETEYTEDLKLMFNLMTIIKSYADRYGGLDDLFKLPESIIHKKLIFNAIDEDIMLQKSVEFERYTEFKQKERAEGERAEGERAEGERAKGEETTN